LPSQLNSASSFVANLSWAYAVLFVSPTVVAVGLSLTIPLSLVGQIVVQSRNVGWLYWIGSATVVLSFVFVNQKEPDNVERREAEQGN
jgi:solute carrier family 35 protein F5